MTFSDFRVIYLGGMGRSGSTLVERLLGELPDVCVAGEVVHLWQRGIVDNERCGCGTEFHDCEFWSGVAKSAFGGWSAAGADRVAELRARVDRTRYVPRLALAGPMLAASARRDADEYVGYYQRLYRAIAEVSGCRTVVDSSKHASLAFCLRRRPDLDLRVVHVVRDSRAVAYSWTTQVRRPESATGGYMTRYSPARAAGQWNTQNAALQWLARCGTPVLRVRYEDLVGGVRPTLTAIARFAGLTADEPELGFIGGREPEVWAELGRTHTAAGNPMRFTVGQIPIRADDRWQAAMPTAARRSVTAITLPLLRHYGYVRGADHAPDPEYSRSAA
jgi:hypothetical protein